MKRIAIVDFDGTICDHMFPAAGEPKEGVADALRTLQAKGYEIHILSCRTSEDVTKHPIDRLEQVRFMERYLIEHNIPFDVVLNKYKPVADIYIDDRGVVFRDNWKEIVEQL